MIFLQVVIKLKVGNISTRTKQKVLEKKKAEKGKQRRSFFNRCIFLWNEAEWSYPGLMITTL